MDSVSVVNPLSRSTGFLHFLFGHPISVGFSRNLLNLYKESLIFKYIFIPIRVLVSTYIRIPDWRLSRGAIRVVFHFRFRLHI